MIVKICGVRDLPSAQACASHGADWVGLNFVTGRRRAITVEQALALLPHLGDCRPVGVFLGQTEAEIEAVCDAVPLWAAQLHGPYTAAFRARLQARGLVVIQAGWIGGLDLAAPAVDHHLVDSREPGSGQRFDPALLTARPAHRLILAGGLDPSNVAAVVRTHRPAGVDCASGIETDGAPDPRRIAAFIRAAREAVA